MAKNKGQTGMSDVPTDSLPDGTAYDPETGEVQASSALAHVDRNSAAITNAPRFVTKGGEVKDLEIAEEGFARDEETDDLASYAAGLGYRKEDIRIITGGNTPFWPCIPGLILCGVIESRRVQNSSLRDHAGNPIQMAGYILRITHERTIAATAESLEKGKVGWLEPGQRIFVIERKLMAEFAERIGQEVIIKCVGRKPSRNNPAFRYWDFRILQVGDTTPAQQSANALTSMASAQRQLASG